MYGAQTPPHIAYHFRLFENDVEMYGAQTDDEWHRAIYRLRMM